MTMMRRFREVRAVRDEDFWGAWAAGEEHPGSTDAGVPISQDRSLRLIAVYACVRVLAEDIASLPIDVFKRTTTAREPVDTPEWISRPNREMTRMELFERVATSLNLDGNAYLAVVRDAQAEIRELWPLVPSQVRVERDRKSNDVLYHVTDEMGRPVGTLEWPNIVHIRGFGTSGIKGLSPIGYARQAIGLGLAAEKFGAQFFGDGATPSSVLETDAKMEDAEARKQLAMWIATKQGRRRPALLHSGMKWKAITVSPGESQFLETRKFQVNEIARLFRVPPHMIGDLDRATFSNIEHQSIDYVVHSLRPWCVRIEQAMQFLFPPGVELRFNVDGLLRGDTKSRFEAYSIGRQIGVYNPDDIRALEDQPPIPDGKGQDYSQPLNWGPLGTDPTKEPA